MNILGAAYVIRAYISWIRNTHWRWARICCVGAHAQKYSVS